MTTNPCVMGNWLRVDAPPPSITQLDSFLEKLDAAIRSRKYRKTLFVLPHHFIPRLWRSAKRDTEWREVFRAIHLATTCETQLTAMRRGVKLFGLIVEGARQEKR
jgi:hypothetical protein